MIVYRICKSQYADDLQDTGSKLFGGRWNHIDFPCIYTAESRALSILEYAMNINIDFIPRALSLCTFKIDQQQIHEIQEEELPGNWRNTPAPKSTKDFGSDLLHSNHSIIKIPSIIIPQEYNYILNPHGSNRAFKLVGIKDFVFDLRIKSK